MAHTQKQEQIIDWMLRFDLSETTIARGIGMKPNKLSYQLNNAQEIKEKYFNDIKNLLIKRKLLSERDECKVLFDLTTDFFASVTTQFNLFNHEVARAIKDQAISKDERARLKVKIDDFVNATLERADEIKSLIGVK
jgi:hypothetical protein